MNINVEGKGVTVPEETKLKDLADAREDRDEILLASVNGSLKELRHKAEEGDVISFVKNDCKAGRDTYKRSASFIFYAAVAKVLGERAAAGCILHFSIGQGFFYTLPGKYAGDPAVIPQIEAAMREMTDSDAEIEKYTMRRDEARRLFARRKMEDNVKLFKTRLASNVNMYRIGGYDDYSYGFIVHRAGLIKKYRLEAYADGIILNMPGRGSDEITDIEPPKLLFKAQREGEEWSAKIGVETVGDLNEKMVYYSAKDPIMISEAMQEGRIAEIAKQINERGDVRFVFVAGPSSSGKTTFSQRLAIQLKARGYRPQLISTDNYYIDRDKVSVRPDGTKDLEGISAIAVDVFNNDMIRLMSGERVRLPRFDFKTGKRGLSDETVSLEDGGILIIEGIHTLSGALTRQIPRDNKFLIYISALTQLNVNEHNRIPTTDGRLIRRLVRDYCTRGFSAAETLEIWENVRKGEEENIFPYQENADVFFNSALPYELGVLKTYAMPLLFQVTDEDAGYHEAKRLLKFLDFFVNIPAEYVPGTSILREFIGEGVFRL